MDITFQGDCLQLEAAPPSALLFIDALRRNRPEIITRLRQSSDCRNWNRRQFTFADPASVAEGSNGLPKLETERQDYSVIPPIAESEFSFSLFFNLAASDITLADRVKNPSRGSLVQ